LSFFKITVVSPRRGAGHVLAVRVRRARHQGAALFLASHAGWGFTMEKMMVNNNLE